MKLYITGDVHGHEFSPRLDYLPTDETIGVIILGDAGFDYYLDGGDLKRKNKLHKIYPNIVFYCVRGNHEARPQSLTDIKLVWDDEVDNFVYMLEDVPYIKYLVDGYIYTIEHKKCLVIGGAYSVDKYHRLHFGWQWFQDEQLSKGEMEYISESVAGQTFDYVLSHTCPLDWEPIDLFIDGIDQSKVDKTMETWMNKLKENINYDHWLFGHYHADRNYPEEKAKMYYHAIDEFPFKDF